MANDTEDKTRDLQRKLYRAAKRSRSRRFHALFDKVYHKDILERAFHEVRKNHGAPGIDGVSIEEIETEGVDIFLTKLATQLQNGEYRPAPVKRVMITKTSGAERPLGIPTVRDRTVQAAVKVVIEPIFEADFCDCSFGFRPKRSALQARERVRAGIRNLRHRWVVDADIKSFFDEVDHGTLMKLLRRRISDRRILKLARVMLKAGIIDEKTLTHPVAGTPQGGVLSPLLANVYLNELDRIWEREYTRLGMLTRYADDLVVTVGDKTRAYYAIAALERILKRLGLMFSAQKTQVLDLNCGQGFDFLGYHFRLAPSRINLNRLVVRNWPSSQAMKAAKQRIRELTPLGKLGLPVIMVVQEINRFLKGWGAYFRWGNSTKQFRALDSYVEERLCRFISYKHGKRGTRRGLFEFLKSPNKLGLTKLTGTVRYPSVHSAR